MSSILAISLQNDLVNLSTEARRKYPEIKEATERLIYILRSLKEQPSEPGIDIVALGILKHHSYPHIRTIEKRRVDQALCSFL